MRVFASCYDDCPWYWDVVRIHWALGPLDNVFLFSFMKWLSVCLTDWLVVVVWLVCWLDLLGNHKQKCFVAVILKYDFRFCFICVVYHQSVLFLFTFLVFCRSLSRCVCALFIFHLYAHLFSSPVSIHVSSCYCCGGSSFWNFYLCVCVCVFIFLCLSQTKSLNGMPAIILSFEREREGLVSCFKAMWTKTSKLWCFCFCRNSNANPIFCCFFALVCRASPLLVFGFFFWERSLPHWILFNLNGTGNCFENRLNESKELEF